MSLSKTVKAQQEKAQKADKLVIEARVFKILGGDPQKEVEMLNKAIGIFPNCYMAYTTKAAVLGLNANGNPKQIGDSKAAIEEAYRINPNSPHVYYTYWKMHNKGASKEDTSKAMSEVLGLKPVTVLDHTAHALAFKTCGDISGAIGVYEQALAKEEFKDSFELHDNLAGLLYSVKRFEEAVAHYRVAVAIEKKHAIGWSDLGNSLMELGQNPEAEAACRKALKLAPKNIIYMHNLANSLDRQQKYEKSIEVEKQILKLDSSNAEAHHGISVSIKHIAHRDLKSKPKSYQKELEKALAENELASAQEPDNILYLSGKADTLIALKRSKEALDIALKVSVLFGKMDEAERADLEEGLPFVKRIAEDEKSKLVSELGIVPAKLQQMKEHIEQSLDDSGTEGHDNPKAGSGKDSPKLSDSGTSDHSDLDQHTSNGGHFDTHGAVPGTHDALSGLVDDGGPFV